ncbi:hypothetical protein AWZ03_009815 [Drosophila navojoa]|uniref:Uncharacterized protein n=1 Tax=Drosophila navojoa TaxID=7232 RepID=A0A484B4X8_DRONA|nr:hypothetical protein AWZ03_009815 [Drosophila navojoa]
MVRNGLLEVLEPGGRWEPQPLASTACGNVTALAQFRSLSMLMRFASHYPAEALAFQPPLGFVQPATGISHLICTGFLPLTWDMHVVQVAEQSI